MADDPQPLALLYSSPRQLLDKAREDLARLRTATFELNDEDRRNALFDACVAVYHVKDWVGVMHQMGDAAEQHARDSKWIQLCRDICNASKHVSLAHTYKRAPPTVERVAVTMSAQVGAGLPVLKVFSKRHGDHYADDVIERAIEDWRSFLDREQIA